MAETTDHEKMIRHKEKISEKLVSMAVEWAILYWSCSKYKISEKLVSMADAMHAG